MLAALEDRVQEGYGAILSWTNLGRFLWFRLRFGYASPHRGKATNW